MVVVGIVAVCGARVALLLPVKCLVRIGVCLLPPAGAHGVSAHGAAAAASHTGSLAGAAKVYGTAFKQAGVTQATDLNDLFDRTLVLSLQPRMKGDNLLILTNGGGVGVLATDSAEKYGLPLHFAPADVQEEMKKHMPDYGSAKNPVDMTGMAGNFTVQSHRRLHNHKGHTCRNPFNEHFI